MRSLFGGTDDDGSGEAPERYSESSSIRMSDLSGKKPGLRFAKMPSDAEASFIVNGRFFDFAGRLCAQRARDGGGGGGRPRVAASEGKVVLACGPEAVMGLASGELLGSAPLSEPPLCLACSPDVFVAGFVGGRLLFRSGLAGGPAKTSEVGAGSTVVALASSGMAQDWWAACADGTVLKIAADVTLTRIGKVEGTVLDMDARGQHVALAMADGRCVVLNELGEAVATFRTFFGAALCVALSYDGKLAAVGGEDDLVTVFSVAKKRIEFRGVGCSSFVTSVSFGPQLKEEGGAYQLCCICDKLVVFFQFLIDEEDLKERGDKRMEVPVLDCVGYAGGFSSRLSDVVWNDKSVVLAMYSGVACIFNSK